MQRVDSTARGLRVVLRMRVILLWVAVFFSPLSYAGTPHVLMDINPHADPISSQPIPLGRLGSAYLFGAQTSASNTSALYRTDFTTSGTVPIKTIVGRGPISTAQPINFLVAGGRAYFIADEAATGQNVWVTDGTADGTHLVADPTPGIDSPQLIGLIGTDLVFLQSDANSVIQLFRTDGTAAGTRVLTQFTQSQRATGEAVIVNGKIYLTVGVSGVSCCADLWVSNGNAGGAHAITDPVTLPAGSAPYSLTVLGSSVLFIARDPYGTEIHRLDTATDTVTMVDLNPGGSGAMDGGRIVALNGFVLFAGTTSNLDGFELYRTDGTLAGTSRVADINPGAAEAFTSSRPWMAKVGNYALFFAQDGTHGFQIWGSDGTPANTAALSSSPSGSGEYSVPIAVVGTHAYFAMALGGIVFGGIPEVLTVTDGTPAGTHQVPLGLILDRDVQFTSLAGDDSTVYFRATSTDPTTNPVTTKSGVYKYEPAANRTTPLLPNATYADPQPMGVDAGRLLFSYYDDVTGREPWISDGTVAGTVLLKNVAPESVTNSSNPASLIDFNGKLWFLADDGTHGQEPWQSDGTVAGTKMVADINPGDGSSYIQRPFVWNGNLYFFANDGGSPGVFMRFDGTVAQTLAIVQPTPQFPSGSNTPYCLRPSFAALGSKLYFSAMDAQNDIELWATDGTPAGTARVADLVPGPTPANPCGLTVFKGRLWFSANDGAGTTQLWSSDGTAAGTSIFTGGWVAAAPWLVYNSELYFSARDANNVTQIWKTDGTTAGSHPLVDVAAGGTPFAATPIGIVKDRLLLIKILTPVLNQPSTYRYELWFSDGTSAGTTKLQSATAVYQSPLLITPDRLYFANSDSAGLEPWVSDGTEAGTRMLADLNPNGDSSPGWMANFRGVVYIGANDPVRGPRLWRTDGTAAGTVAVGDVGASPASAVVSGQNLFFTAIDPVMGRELYILPNDAPAAASDSGSSANGASVALNVTTNDSDTDGTLDLSSVHIVSAPAHGTASVGAGGVITYAPTAGYSGADSFTYTVADNQGNASNAATVSLTVTAASGSGGGGGGGSSGGGGGGGALGVLDLAGLLALVLLANGLRRRRRVTFAHGGLTRAAGEGAVAAGKCHRNVNLTLVRILF